MAWDDALGGVLQEQGMYLYAFFQAPHLKKLYGS